MNLLKDIYLLISVSKREIPEHTGFLDKSGRDRKSCWVLQAFSGAEPNIQKDLVLKIAELFCNKDISDGRAKYWVEKAARLLPGNAAALRLKEKLQEYKVEDGWNELFYVTQAELRARPDDV